MMSEITNKEVIERLNRGNDEYLHGNNNTGDVSVEARKCTANEGQHPYAIVITCSDSRVIPETIFSARIGDLFVIRVAGNVLDNHQLGSVEYAFSHLDANVIVMLGHTKCGAIEAARYSHAKHNEEILSEYKSPMESFNKVVAGIQKAGESFISKKPVAEYKYTGMLGEVDKTEDDKNVYKSRVAEIFAKYAGKSDLKTVMDMLKTQYENYATNDSDDKGFRQYVSKEADYLFDNIEKYWDVVLSK